MFRVLFVLPILITVGLTGCAMVSQTEYADFKPMPPKARVINNVKLTWEVREDVGDYCLSTQKRLGKSQGAAPLACAIWTASLNECKVVTGPNPNHVVLGHEVRHCFEGNFHP